MILSREGFETQKCSSGFEAVKFLDNKEHFDLVISDVSMPGMRGSDLAVFMRQYENYKQTPIILLSAECDGKLIDSLVKNNIINCYQPKPFRPNLLVNMVNVLLIQSSRVKPPTEKPSMERLK